MQKPRIPHLEFGVSITILQFLMRKSAILITVFYALQQDLRSKTHQG